MAPTRLSVQTSPQFVLVARPGSDYDNGYIGSRGGCDGFGEA
jgi:hypothetical protein